MRIQLWLLLLVPVSLQAASALRGNLGVHDPSTILKCKEKYYLFGTGDGILSKSSTDRVFWSSGPNVFTNAPAWTTNAVPGFTGTIWAPDVFYLNGRYCLYYAISTWGSQISAIGLVTNPTLDPADPAYCWTDQGIVIQSQAGSPYNTIDPSVTVDASGNPWMAFGSYWSGIYIVQLDPATGLRLSSNSPTYRVAYNSSIEASCLFRRGSYYYLFVNWGSCCSGVNSTYNVRVGRSAAITGPYRDRNGVDLAANGGTLFLEGTGKYTGPGHVGILTENNTQWFSYHYYDAGAYASWYGAYGQADFDLEPLSWTADGWPAFTNDWAAVYRFQYDARDENGQYYGWLLNGASTRSDALYGRVLNLSGTNQYVQLPSGVGFARTFSAVVKWGGGGAWQRIFDFGTDTSSYVMLTPSSGDGKLRCDIRANGTTQTIQAANPLPIGVWSQVALTFDGSRGVLYLNGVVVANSSVTLSPLDVRAQTNHLGHSKFVDDPDFKGQIAEFRAFGRVLSAAELAAPRALIAEPVEGSTYRPGDVVVFAGGAADLYAASIPPSNLTWTVRFHNSGLTNTVFGPATGITNSVLSIPATGVMASNGFYQITLTAVDNSGRRATNAVNVFPATNSQSAASWASFYPFTAGANDASNRYNGVPMSGASFVTDATRGKVLSLSGAGQYVLLPSGVGGLRTFGLWVKWNGGAAWQRILDFGQDTSRWLMLTPLDGDGRMQCSISTELSSYVRVIQTATAFPIGTWIHVAVVFDGRQGILYTNGQVAAINHSVNLLPSDIAGTRCYLGKSQFSVDAFFNGRLDSLRLTSRSLDPIELFGPVPVITQPAAGAMFAGGATVMYAGSATDYADTALSADALSWSAEFQHDGQYDPVFGPVTGVTAGSFQVPGTGPATTNMCYRVNLTVTDTNGIRRTASAGLVPRISWLTLDTVPSGLEVDFDGQASTAPAIVAAVAGFTRTLNVPSPQLVSNQLSDFRLWSDGGARTHSLSVPFTNAAYYASFVSPVVSCGWGGTDLVLCWPAWAAPMRLVSTTNLSSPAVWTEVTNLPTLSNQMRVLSIGAINSNRFFRLQLP